MQGGLDVYRERIKARGLKGAHKNAASRRGRLSEAAKDKGSEFTTSRNRQHRSITLIIT